EWLSIPEEYGKRVELVKTRIASLQADPDLSAVLRDTAIVINDLQAALQVELGDIQVFLAKVTSRLEEVESCFRDLSSSEKENRKDTKQLNTDIQTSVNNIRLGITESDDIQAMKQSIESRLSFIEQSAGNYLQSSQKRQQFWEGTVNILKGRIQSMKGETVSLHKRIQIEYKRAKTDALTRIANRLAYNEKIKQEFARWQRNAQPFSVCVIDVDKFKGVNDSYGHKAGDKVLKTIAEVCAANIRKMDFFARYGGEEFVLLLPDTALDQAIVVAENLRRKIEVCKFHYAKETVVITVSCGLAQFDKGDTTESVFNRADKALYAAKDQGRNQVMRG
ncbi:MAG: diguanylate cyclase, partial [Gammaproteobacteria bacterium]